LFKLEYYPTPPYSFSPTLYLNQTLQHHSAAAHDLVSIYRKRNLKKAVPKMSFFARLSDDSSSDSGSESEESILSGDEGAQQDRALAQKNKNRFLRSDGSDDSDSESEDEELSDDSEANREVRSFWKSSLACFTRLTLVDSCEQVLERGCVFRRG
jgi:hypothetical protein